VPPLSPVTCDTFPGASSGVSTFFRPDESPAVPQDRDGMTRLVLGVRFTTAVAGRITAFRFLKALYESSPPTNGGVRSGRVYKTDTGELVASVRFSDADCDGGSWVVAPLLTPLCLSANSSYTLAVDDVLSFVKTDAYFPSYGTARGHVKLLDGVYGFVPNTMPDEDFNRASNYWVDCE
jgi:hypothetical protein